TFSKKPNSIRSITLVKGWAKFKDSKTVIVQKEKDDIIEIQAKNFIIATGSSPRKHPLLEIDKKRVIDSDYISSIKKFPKKLLIVGAGIIGCEFATIFANFGQTEVHLLDSQKRVIPFEDDDVSDYVNKKLLDIGVIHHDATLREIRKNDKDIDVILDYSDGHTKVIAVDTILVSIGRVPNTTNLGLENTGVKLNSRGIIEVDSECRADKNIYAVGDISGNMALVNIAEMEGRFAVKAIESKITFPLSYHNISTIMFFNPEISAIGLTEKECQAKNISYKVITYQHSIISRAIAMRETDGFFKIIVTNEENPLILGMRTGGLQSAVSVIFIAGIMNNYTRLNDIMKTL
ncbi:MAG: NAD(P)/FAD-dependent oxidoreductase, partial [Sulfurovaceae bacterium]|nr:NAD(P)/FAD-dependent oxidoreductase [Sulfurovaceae bacterium]